MTEGDRIGRLVSAGLIALIAANVAAVIIESELWVRRHLVEPGFARSR